MSYHRSDAILSKDLFEYCTYVVREEEADKYRDAGIDDLLVIPNGATTESGCRIFNFITTLHWLIENSKEDVIFVADDDIKYFEYRTDVGTNIKTTFANHREIVTSEIERIAQLLVDLNIGLAYDSPCASLYAYTSELAFKGTPGGIRWINKRALKATVRPEDDAASDLDMIMQELLKNRITLQTMYFLARNIQYTNAGGSDEFSSGDNKIFHLAMKNKWGKYFDFDYNRNIPKINVKR